MGFLDILNGMQNGPRGQVDPNAKGGMSPITMAILALLAYKGIKHFGSGNRQPAPGAPQQRLPGGAQQQPAPAGGGSLTQQAGLDDVLGGLFGGGARRGAAAAPGGSAGGGDLGSILSGGLGGLLAGGAAGSILSGGLGSLLEQFQQNGQGQTAQSWVGKGPNDDISESDLAKSIGSDDIDALARHTGLSRNDLLAGLSRELPGAIDEMTPHGRLPTADEASRWV